jgi:hypothetical protein
MDSSGQTLGFATRSAYFRPQPDGAPAPELFASTGSVFSPLGFSPLSLPGRVGTAATNLVLVAFNASGQGWLAGAPAPFTSSGTVPTGTVQDAPLAPITETGASLPCPGTAGAFTTDASGATPSYTWSALGVMPDGTAVAGGSLRHAGSPSSAVAEPILVMASCAQGPVPVRFQAPSPFNPSGAPVPADLGGGVTAVAANAVNDVWAATSPGTVFDPVTGFAYGQPPHLYRWTDGAPPQAPAGDDREVRTPIVTQAEQTLYVFQPPVTVPPPPRRRTIIRRKPAKLRRVTLPSPVYSLSAPVVRRVGPGRYTFTITFKVRSRVTIELVGLRAGAVVSSSGMHTFTRGTGSLVLMLTARHWPNGLRFVLPPAPKR